MDNNTVWTVYSTDNHHTQHSRRLQAIAGDKESAIEYLTEKAEEIGGAPLREQDIRQLNEMNQTQGYGNDGDDGDGEFVIEEHEIYYAWNLEKNIETDEPRDIGDKD